METQYKGLDDMGEDQGTRRRNKPDVDHSDEGIYSELQRLRNLVDEIEGDKRSSGGSSCLKLGLDNSMMSTIFGLIFITICTVTIYAFCNIYRAISKRFFTPDVVE